MSIKLNNKTIKILKISELIALHIETPNIQRIKEQNKIDNIVEYQLKNISDNGFANFLGVINLHYCRENNQYYLVDGQHRFESLKCLLQTHSHDIDIFVEIVEVKNNIELKKNYEMINKNTILPDFPENIDRNIPQKTAEYFQCKYSSIWSKSSTRIRRPHICFNFFQETLGYITEQLGDSKISDFKDLIKIVEEYNQNMLGWDESQFLKGGFNNKMLKKAKECKFFLGFHSHTDHPWGYEWGREIVRLKTGVTPKKIRIKVKKTVPKKVKLDSWNKYIGPSVGECLCIICNNSQIRQGSFEAGHIISEKQGGKCTVGNILPICSECNKSMGIRRMDEYVIEHYPNNNNFTKREYYLEKPEEFIKIIVNNIGIKHKKE